MTLTKRVIPCLDVAKGRVVDAAVVEPVGETVPGTKREIGEGKIASCESGGPKATVVSEGRRRAEAARVEGGERRPR